MTVPMAGVRAPSTDRPASSDPTTAILVWSRLRRRGYLQGGAVLTAINVAVQVLLAVIGSGHMLAATTSVLAASAVFAYLVVQFGHIRDAPAVDALLGTQPWRPVDVRIVRGPVGLWTRSVVEVGDVRFEASGPSPAHLAVLARSGTAWLIGPDARGRAAMRIEGSHEAWPARVRLGSVKPGRLPVVGANVDRLWATWLAAWPRLSRRGLVGLLNAGEWSKVTASVAPWQAWHNNRANAIATIHTADGRVLTLDMRGAPVDLLGTIWDTGSLWVVGDPAPDKTVAVGYPGYPLVTEATISEAAHV
ncbi:MAG TPA: hypothetical protein VM677_25830 [Actinokineospora sp.]|jgi:hypothetical protein|nr:hypothetical protein [Actinokineospora sp.]